MGETQVQAIASQQNTSAACVETVGPEQTGDFIFAEEFLNFSL